MRGLNIGAGRATFPTTKENPFTEHLNFALEAGCSEAYDSAVEWVNIDRIASEKIQEVVNVFRYPWIKQSDHKPFEDNTFDVVWCSHIVEHIPHDIKMADYGGGQGGIPSGNPSGIPGGIPSGIPGGIPSGIPSGIPGGIQQHLDFVHHDSDGWFSWFYEVWRIMKPGGSLHILCPYGNSIAAFTDPTHTRLIMPGTFSYFSPNPKAPFDYDLPMHFELATDTTAKFPNIGLYKITNESLQLRDKMDELNAQYKAMPEGGERDKLREQMKEFADYIDKFTIRHFAQIEEMYFVFIAVK